METYLLVPANPSPYTPVAQYRKLNSPNGAPAPYHPAIPARPLIWADPVPGAWPYIPPGLPWLPSAVPEYLPIGRPVGLPAPVPYPLAPSLPSRAPNGEPIRGPIAPGDPLAPPDPTPPRVPDVDVFPQPGNNPSTQPRPQARPRRPQKGEKEVKKRWKNKATAAAMRGLGVITEGLDNLMCVQKGLPRKFRAKPVWVKGDRPPGNPTQRPRKRGKTGYR